MRLNLYSFEPKWSLIRQNNFYLTKIYSFFHEKRNVYKRVKSFSHTATTTFNELDGRAPVKQFLFKNFLIFFSSILELLCFVYHHYAIQIAISSAPEHNFILHFLFLFIISLVLLVYSKRY